MTEKKLYLIIQSVLCVLMVILLVASAISIYCEGRALRAEDPMASIYTREKVVEKLRPISPLFFAAVGLTIAGWLLTVKDDNADKPVKDAESTRNLTVACVRLNGKELKEGDCELTWSEGCKDPGTYQVTARLRKGILAGADTAKFIIMEAADEGVLTLPAGLLLIESEAFAGVNAETTEDLPMDRR